MDNLNILLTKFMVITSQIYMINFVLLIIVTYFM